VTALTRIERLGQAIRNENLDTIESRKRVGLLLMRLRGLYAEEQRIKKVIELVKLRPYNIESDLTCPHCHAPDRNNKMNGEPWCVRCDRPLTKKGSKQGSVKVLDKYAGYNLVKIGQELNKSDELK